MKIFFLLNPAHAKNRWDWREVAARHAKRLGWTPRFGEVERRLPASSERLLDQAIEEGCSRVVVVGGDGSLHRAINALSQKKCLASCELAVVPAGTCNDFARFLGLRRQGVDEAFHLACSGKSKPIDLGRMDQELFLNNAGFGRPPDPPGQRRKPLQTLQAFRPLVLRATWDKGTVEGSFYMGLVCNAPYFSGGLRFSMQASLQDGLLDVSLVPVIPKWQLLSILVLGRLGRPAKLKRILTIHTSRLDIEADADLWPQADGEPPPSARRRVSFAVSDEKAMIVAP